MYVIKWLLWLPYGEQTEGKKGGSRRDQGGDLTGQSAGGRGERANNFAMDYMRRLRERRKVSMFPGIVLNSWIELPFY